MAGSNVGLECRVLVCMDSNVDIKTVSKKTALLITPVIMLICHRLDI